jgi:hypothetical protein
VRRGREGGEGDKEIRRQGEGERRREGEKERRREGEKERGSIAVNFNVGLLPANCQVCVVRAHSGKGSWR